MHAPEPNRWKGLVLGVVGGAAGVVAMGYYWQAVTALTGQDPRQATTGAGPHALDDISLVGVQHQGDESSTAAIGRLADQALTGKEPRKETKALLSTGVHWGYGLLVGGLYGLGRGGTARPPDGRGGLIYGTGVWLLGSEVALPLLGLTAGPTTQPVASHAYGLGAHWAYGLATAATTQVLYQLL
ncbi:MAG: DUF1440 domain-containing protein [Candidatus Dormibacteraeota bacterium]|nr:DUF1440 domain-containing protein [Candidatus Dormibacteraeota bacterium]